MNFEQIASSFERVYRYSAGDTDYNGIRGDEPLGFELPTGDGSFLHAHTPRKVAAMWLEDQGREGEADAVQWHDGPLTYDEHANEVQPGRYDTSAPVQLEPHEHRLLREYHRNHGLPGAHFNGLYHLGEGVVYDPQAATEAFRQLVQAAPDDEDEYDDNFHLHQDNWAVHRMLNTILNDHSRLAVAPISWADYRHARESSRS